MSSFEVKKLITGFLILAAIVSSSAFLFSGFIGDNTTSQNQERNNNGGKPLDSAQGKVPDNVFVEPIPPSTAVKSGGRGDDGLPSVGASSNLTDRLAENLTRGLVETNPDGPSQGGSGQLSVQAPDLDSVIKKTLSTNNLNKLQSSGWNVHVSDADIKIIKNPSLNDIQNYSGALSQIISDGIGNPETQNLLRSEDNSLDAINAMSVAIDRTDIALRKLSVPEPLANFHKDFLTIVTYEKRALGASNSDDPISEMLALRNEERNISLVFANFENEAKKAGSLIGTSSLNEDAFSALAGLFEIKSAHALFGLDALITVARMAWEWIARHIESAILQGLKNQLVHKIMVQTLNWVQGGGGNPQFITNWRGFLGQAENEAAGLAIKKYIPGLCRSLGPLIQLQLNRTYLSEPIVTCTLDQVVQNVKNFYNDFSQGGWVGYGAMLLPSGNYYGALFETTQKIEADRLAARNAAKSDAESSGGFLSTQRCVKHRLASDFDECVSGCVNFVGPQPVGAPPCVQSCAGKSTVPKERECTDKQNTTPGEVVGQSVSTAISAPLHNIVNAQDIIGVVSAFVDSMVSRLFKNGVKGLLGLTMKNSINGKEPNPPGVVTETATCGTVGNNPQQPPQAEIDKLERGDMGNVVVDWSQDANVTGWPISQNNRLDSVSFAGGNICLNHTPNPLTWPDQADGTFPDVPANGWVMVWRGGQWHASTFEYYYRSGSEAQCRDAGSVWDNSHISDFTPIPNEAYGFMLSGLARAGHSNVQERSNVVVQTWAGPTCVDKLVSGGGNNPHLEPNHTADVQSAKDALGNPPGPCGAFHIIKNTAKKIGAGLLLTDLTSDENYCEGYSADNIVFSDGWLIDALGDAGGDNNAQWNDNGTTDACSYKHCRFVSANDGSLP